ncbi:hypothetical protein D3C81_1840980 [compost metagenome]
MPEVWNVASPVSASVMDREPESVRFGLLASSVTAPTLLPAITAASLTPVMVTTTSWLVPSRALTVKVSTLVSPAWRYCTAALATL